MRISATGRLYAAIGGLFLGLVAVTGWRKPDLIPSFFGPLGNSIHLFLTKTLFFVGGQPVRVWFLIKCALFLFFLTLLARLARSIIRIATGRNANFGDHRQFVFGRAVSFLIYAVGIFIGIHVESINLSTLVILGGTLGVGVGLGLQPLVANLIAGLVLFFEQPIRIGDRIEFGNKAGEVVRIGNRSSWIKTNDNALLIIPNSEFVTKDVLNWTASDPKVRVSVPVSVAHGSNIEQAMQVLLTLAAEHVDVMHHPCPEVLLTELGLNSITFTLRVWTIKGANDFHKLRSDIYQRIVQRFREEKIELPFPQLDVHWKSNPSSPDGPRERTGTIAG